MSKTEVLSQSTGPGYEKVDNIQLQDMAATKVDNNIGPPMIKEQQLAGPNGYYKPPGAQTETSSEADSADLKNNGRVFRLQRAVGKGCSNNSTYIIRAVLLLLLVGYTVYFAFAIKHSVKGARALIVLTSLTVFLIGYYYVKKYFGKRIYKGVCVPLGSIFNKVWPILRW